MKTRPCLLLISALLAFWTHRLRAANDFSISANDKTLCRIIIPSNASASQRYAAEELQHYIERITSVRLAIADDSTKPESREILLGDNAHLRKLGVKIDFKALGQ